MFAFQQGDQMQLLLVKLYIGDGPGSSYHSIKKDYVDVLRRRFKLNENDAVLTAIYNSSLVDKSQIVVKKSYFEDLDGSHYSVASIQDITESKLLVLEEYIYVNRV